MPSRYELLARVDGQVDVDEHVVAVDGHGVDGHGPDGRQGRRLAGAQVEARSVQPALDRAVVDLTLRQGHLGVAAGVVDRVDVALLVADDRHGETVDDDATAPTSGRSPTESTRSALIALPRCARSTLRGALCSWFARSARSRRHLVLRPGV